MPVFPFSGTPTGRQGVQADLVGLRLLACGDDKRVSSLGSALVALFRKQSAI